jgi:nucleotide-binding universal stress UspA family protein
MRILLAIDGSEQSEAAVDEIARRRFPADSEIRVIAVVEPPYLGKGLERNFYGVDAEKTAREHARAAVDKAAAKLEADGSRQFNVTTEVVSGSPRGVILEEAEAFGADLIVVGSHGHGMLERFLLGSVSQAVVLHARCSVEIVRMPEVRREVMRILVATDGSEQSEAAVDEIARQHFPADTEVRVISVVEPPNFGEGVDMSFYVEIEKIAHERARAAVEKAAARLRADEESLQLNVTTEVISGPPKRVILERAEAFSADLIVVGSHGHGMLGRFLLGSVSQAVALHARCSVEIVRSRKTQTSESK